MLDSTRYPQAELARRIRIALARAALSPSSLAKICGVTKQAVNGWLTTGRISKHHLMTISTLTDTPLEFFFEQERGSTPKTKKLWGKLSVVSKAAMLTLALTTALHSTDSDASFGSNNAFSVYYVKCKLTQGLTYLLTSIALIFVRFYPNFQLFSV